MKNIVHVVPPFLFPHTLVDPNEGIVIIYIQY